MAVSSGMASFSVRSPAPAPAALPCAASAAADRTRMRVGNDAGGTKWWAPLLSWSGQPDYIDAQPAMVATYPPPPQPLCVPTRRFDVLTEDKEELDRWEMQMNQRVRHQVVAQVHAEMNIQHGHAHPCPTCLRPSPKVGNNNHLFCWACQRHFCALCHKPVPKHAQHYSLKGCKQHSADP